ncbi:MAG TPA: bacillithiol biosynthesis cysteine-adding enzyme BshC [Candidatus Eisenbacteria bacterium]|nr:bacillithiol biosynthesis cysteine-adding enzyme BshC [Candidatus Eisenbacteria bacterium]
MPSRTHSPVATGLEHLLYPSPLYYDFLTSPERVREFYPVDYRDGAAAARSAASRSYPAERRAAIASVMKRQASELGAASITAPAIAKFEKKDTLAVVAGQQPGLFGGPLYTVYKALTCVHLARRVEEASGRPTVPIFWVASDDHDFDEVRKAWVTDGLGSDPVLLEYEAGGPHASFSRIRIGAAIEPALAKLEESLGAAPEAGLVMARLKDAYAPGRTWAEAFARFMAGVVAPLGMIVFDPADAEAKRLALPVFEREVELGGRSAAVARDRGEALVRRGYHAQIARAGNELNLFWHGGAEREAVRVDEDGAFRAAGGQRWTRQELLDAVRARPEDLSPGVLLRPLVEDYLLPTAAYVGGPSEVAYWAQVFALYPLFEMAPPAIAPRAGATLLEPKVARTLNKFHLSWESLSGDVEVVIREALRAILPEQFRDVFEEERKKWSDGFRKIEEQVLAFDPSLKPAVITAHGRVEREIETLEKKLLHVWKRRQEESVQQIRRARSHLFPHGELQERVACYAGFASRHGAWLTERLMDALQDPGAHELVSLGGSS